MILGHQKQAEIFFASEQKAHRTWIFHGIKGIGKATLAKEWLAKIMAGKKNPHEKILNQIHEKSYADGLCITGNPSIGVDDARNINDFLHKTQSFGGGRFCLVDSLGDMTMPAMNALLKAIEEPPKNTTIVLIHHAGKAILDTLYSRAFVLNFQPLEQEDMKQFIKMRELPHENDILPLAAGSPGRALLLQDYWQDYQGIIPHVASIFNEKKDFVAIHKLADQLSRDAIRFGMALQFMAHHAHKMALSCDTPHERNAYVVLWEKIMDAKNQVEAVNLDKKQTFIQLFL